jgi:riboflavin biosynthesis pyrimidine reductase
VQRIYPPGPDGPAGPDLPGWYAYPGPEQTGGHPWVRANMIESADGAAEVGGRSGGLSGPPDRVVFGLLRALAEVILVGAGTARAERYRPARADPRWAALRAGRPATPPVAVLTRRLDLDLDGPLLTGAAPGARTIVITTGAAPEPARQQAGRHADVITLDGQRADLGAAIAALAGRGYRRILVEGGPHLLGQLAAAGLVDELCVTISPVLAGGTAGRIVAGPGAAGGPARLALAHVLEDGGFLFCRYQRDPADGRPGLARPV